MDCEREACCGRGFDETAACRTPGYCGAVAVFIIVLLRPGFLAAGEPDGAWPANEPAPHLLRSAVFDDDLDEENEVSTGSHDQFRLTSEWSNSHFDPGGKSQQWSADGFNRPDTYFEEPPASGDAVFAEPSTFQWLGIQATGAWLAGGGSTGFGIAELDWNGSVSWRFWDQQPPLIITAGFGVNFLSGALSDFLPSRVYNSYIDFNWRPRLTDSFGLNLGVTPGLYGDYREIDSQTLQWSGWALGEWTASPTVQVVAGAVFVRQLQMGVLPAGGVIWLPDDQTRFELIFPRPRIARRFNVTDRRECWGYVGGQLGGGAWSVALPDNSRDLLRYSDLRLVLGAEWLNHRGLLGVVEAGCAFDRHLFLSNDSAFPNPTLLLRAGISF